MPNQKQKYGDFLFECSWEVCNKVGGINTVLISKASEIKERYGESYFLVGPYFLDKTKGQFQEELPDPGLRQVFDYLEKIGIKCHKGKWLVESEPNAILIDFINFWPRKNAIKKELWDNYKVDSLNSGYDYDEPLVWSYATGLLIEQLANLFQGKKIIAHFHEWLSGAGLLYLTGKNPNIKTVFTTHATTLGRTLANDNIGIYSMLDKFDVTKEIYKYNITAKHELERVAAEKATVFSTVSEVTNIEAKYLLGKSVDKILPNGLDLEKFPTFEEITMKHRIQRDRIREFLQYFFFPYYTFDLEQTLIYFIASRYEFKNKGIDVTIKSLGLLNERLKAEKVKKNIVVFFWIPAAIRGVRMDLLENKIAYQDMKDLFVETEQETKDKLLRSLVSGEEVCSFSLFPKEFLAEMKKKILVFKRKGNPSFCTHDLVDKNDIILKKFQEAGLNNSVDDKVKVIFYPVYLSGSDGLLNLSYYESITGSHLGIFPSYYEPWGYTPLETAALGVASVTSDLSGFGKFIAPHVENKQYPGIFLLKYFLKKEEEVVNDLAEIMHTFAMYSRHERIQNKINAREIAAMADWKILIKEYFEAYRIAISK